jgi:hypothetical protein
LRSQKSRMAIAPDTAPVDGIGTVDGSEEVRL